METTWEKIKTTVTDHPYIVLGVVAVVALYFLWPSSSTSGGSSTTADEAAAIAAASQANEQLSAAQIQSQTDMALAQDQLQATNAQTAAAQAINAQNDTAATSIATLGANVTNAQTAAALSLGQTAYATNEATNWQDIVAQQNLAVDANVSQAQSENFLAGLLKAGVSTPSLSTPTLSAGAVSDPTGSTARTISANNLAGEAINGLNQFFAIGTNAAGSGFANNLGGAESNAILSLGKGTQPQTALQIAQGEYASTHPVPF